MYYKRHTILSEGAPIADSFAPGAAVILDAVLVHVSSAPTTSEYLTLTLDHEAGAAWDTVIYKIDLSAASTTDIVITPADLGVLLTPSDALRLTYTNTDLRTIGVTYQMR